MAETDLWEQMLPGGEALATEEDYEHGYARVVRGDLQKYVVFAVAEERYGIPIHEIGEIAKPIETTPVPRTSDFVVGIGNVRGVVIPVIDLARRLRLPSAPTTRATRVLIVRHDGEQYGLIVHAVEGVVQIAPEELEDAPGTLGSGKGDFIHSLCRGAGGLIIVLDLTSLLNPQDFVDPRASAASGGPRDR